VLVDGARPLAPADALAGSGIEIVGRTAEPAVAAQLAVELRPQVVVVDLDAGPAALAAIAAVTAADARTPVLALAADPGHAVVLDSVRAGATGLIVTAGPGALMDAVERTGRREAVFSPGLADVVLREFGGRPVDARDGAGRLTGREGDVLRLVVEGLTARQIATRLVLSPRTVENHVQSVLRKLQLHSRAALVRYAIENGLA
jgi:DNA-binding NarL/FixJ family response regulator